MAITIEQQPTYPNVTYTSLLYAVSSTTTEAPQFQYVMDVVSGSQILTRIKQYPNPSSNAIFEVGRILNDYLEYPTDVFDITSSVDFGSSQQSFTINFGEEYGTSPSSSVVLYNGSGAPGNPSVTGTTATVWPGTIDPNNGVGYNWDDNYDENIYLTSYPNSQTGSSDFNYKKVGKTDYGVIAFKGSDVTSTPSNVTLKRKDGLVITTKVLGGTKDANGTYLPSGPQNLLDLGVTPTELDFAELYTISVGTHEFNFLLDGCNDNYDRVNFLFINKFGVWDNYGVNLPFNKTTNLNRKSIMKPFVNYSSTTSPYDSSRRGMDYYNISTTDSYTISTDFLTRDEAAWLSEMIESPSVFIQTDNGFSPIVITNSAYTHNTNKKAQRIFQYTIEYQFANQRIGR